MKQWITLALTFTLLMALASPGAAQQKAGETEKPGALKGGAAGMSAPRPSSPSLMTGKVTGVNGAAKTFTVMAKGTAVTFTAAKLKVLPKVGEIVDITYTGIPGGPLEATTVKGSKSNSDN
jgi:hypothetical protein